MQRTRVFLTPEQYRCLAEEARRLDVSVPAVICRLIAEHSRRNTPDEDPLTIITGMAEGDGQAVGREHNCYLYGK